MTDINFIIKLFYNYYKQRLETYVYNTCLNKNIEDTFLKKKELYDICGCFEEYQFL